MISSYATNIALIDKATNTVTNIIWGNIYQEDEFTNDEQLALVTDDLAIAIGDIYDGEHFYHEGEMVLSVAEKLALLQAELEKAKADLADADDALHALGAEWESE